MFADEQLLRELNQSPLIRNITEVTKGYASLNDGDSNIGADVINEISVTGTGQTIVIMDTDLDYNHPMLSVRVVNGACFSANRATETHHGSDI